MTISVIQRQDQDDCSSNVKVEVELNELINLENETTSLPEQNFRKLLPQILAGFVVQSYNILAGMAYAFSAYFIPQLEKAQTYPHNSTNIIRLTESDGAWITSVLVLIIPATSLLCGFCVDKIGRLNMFKIAVIPNVIGWGLIATGSNIPIIIIGRIFTGISMSLGTTSAMVYTAEISNPTIRGPLMSLSTAVSSVGSLLGYVHGWYLNWRLCAWLIATYNVLLVLFVMLVIPESPSWLISKNRLKQAFKSLKWFNRYTVCENDDLETHINLQMNKLQSENNLKQEHQTKKGNITASAYVKMFAKPTVYKPLCILGFMFLFHSMSGIYITLFYAISFFEDVGTTIDPYLASICMATIRAVMSFAALWLMKKFNRRPLVLTSTIGMALCMAISGYFTNRIITGRSSKTWIPVSMILLYIFSTTIGFLSIPVTMMAELFPLSVRGIAHSITFGFFNIALFTSLQMYYDLKLLLGGASGMQYFFSIVALLGFLYCYAFLPETRNKKLTEIEDYFEHHTTYLSTNNKTFSTKFIVWFLRTLSIIAIVVVVRYAIRVVKKHIF